jgi:hypothetical protein
MYIYLRVIFTFGGLFPCVFDLLVAEIRNSSVDQVNCGLICSVFLSVEEAGLRFFHGLLMVWF